MSRRARVCAVLLALLVLTTGAVQALPAVGAMRVSESEGVLARIWGWLSAVFLVDGSAPSGGLTAIWEQDGSHLDPNGNS